MRSPGDESDCLFCRILRGEIPSREVPFADATLAQDLYAFEDIQPQAPVHVLVIPRRHIPTIDEVSARDTELMGKLVRAARDVAHSRRLPESGYRIVINCQEGAGQSVFHVHLHVLGGRRLSWPPG